MGGRVELPATPGGKLAGNHWVTWWFVFIPILIWKQIP